MLDRLDALVRRHHAWLAAGGLCGLALYQASRGRGAEALHALIVAGGLLGLHLSPRRPAPPEPPDIFPEKRDALPKWPRGQER